MQHKQMKKMIKNSKLESQGVNIVMCVGSHMKIHTFSTFLKTTISANFKIRWENNSSEKY